MINEHVQNLITINNSIEGQEMSFENALSIVKLYDEMPEPNNLIDEAEEMAAYNIDALEKSVMKLKEESERFLSVGVSRLKNNLRGFGVFQIIFVTLQCFYRHNMQVND